MDFQPIEIGFIILGLCISGLSTLISAVIASISSGRLEEIEQSDSTTATRLFDAKQYRSRAEHSLTFTDFTGIILAAVFAGHVSVYYEGSWLVTLYASLLLFAFILLFKALLQGIGDRYANQLAIFSSAMLGVIVPVTKPFVLLMQWFTSILASEQTAEEVREEMEDEITAIMDEAVEEGTLDADEYRILTNIMQFSEVTVEDVMTPRNVVFSVPSSKTIGEVVSMHELMMYSRFPIWEEESLDSVIGYVMTKDVLRAALNGKSENTIKTILREVYFIPENVQLDKALEEFLQRRQHMFVVVDEYGGVEGLITMEDVVETILGAEIVDEADRIVDMRQLAKHRRDKRIAANIVVRDESPEV
ncbi:MAG: CBS domain-containing protein [Candidatus Kapaibacterium sp.]|nr:CBS domain-containing protein [Bacteroidota bacterium]